MQEFRTRIRSVMIKDIEKTFPIGIRVAFVSSMGDYIRLGRVSGHCRQVHPDTFCPFTEPVISWDIKSIVFIDGPCNPLCLRIVKEVNVTSNNKKQE